MKITKEFTDDNQVKITAEIEPEVYEQFKHRASRKISQSTRIPGFRPGKAPYNRVLMHVGEPAIARQAVDLLIDDAYPKILEQEEIKPWGPGNLDAIKSENPPIFEFTIPLEPSVELQGIEKLSKPYQPQPTTEEDVTKFIDEARRNSAIIVPLETKAAEGNVVFISLQAEDKKPEDGKDPVVVKPTPQQVLIPTKKEQRSSEWPFEGFARSLIGHKADETVEFNKDFPVDYSDPDFAGKSILFKVDIQAVKGLELPELDREYLQSIGGFETVDDLRTAVKSRLEAQNKESYDNVYYLDLVDQLRQQSVIKYAPQMLAQEEEQVLHRIEHDLEHRKMTLDLLLKIRNKTLDEYKNEEIKPAALHRLERSLVMDALTKHFSIKVENEHLESEVSNVVNGLIMSGEFQELQKSLGQKKFAETVTIEAANRSLENAIRAKLLEIADPSAVVKPNETEKPEAEKPEAEDKPAKKPARKTPTKKSAEDASIEEAPQKKTTRRKKAETSEE
ncbi:MAG: trigger factor [Chloroflexi bacterium]|nr:trigger factor [Chloroflexota bacterium]